MPGCGLRPDTHMEGFVVRHQQRIFRFGSTALVGLPLAAGLLAGGSSRSIESEPPARVTVSSDPVRRTIRPVPEVIARPRPFRLPESLGKAPHPDQPATMLPGAMLPGGWNAGRAGATVSAEVVAAAAAGATPSRPGVGDGEPALLLPSPGARSVQPSAAAAGSVTARLARMAAAERTAPDAPSRPDAGAAPEVAEIRDMIRGYLRAFNRHDPAALAAHWSRDGENLDLDSGETTAGRQAVEQVFAALFRDDAGATIDIDIVSIRPLRRDVAVVDGISLISFSDEPPSSSRFSAVVGKQDGRWVLESVREAALPSSERESHPLDELAWLVGSWEDISEGVTAETQCFWSTGKGFLIRSHAVSRDEPSRDGGGSRERSDAAPEGIPELLSTSPTRNCELTEIIGWDPQRKQIRSWVFTSNGRFAQGSWSRDGESWRVHLEGGGGDADADCTYRLSRVGPDEITVRCDSDGLADLMPPAVDSVRTARLLDANHAIGRAVDRP